MRSLFYSILSAILLAPSAVLATANPYDQYESAGAAVYGTSDSNIYSVIGSIIEGLLALLGIVLLIIVIYAGILWMTAGGNSGQVDKARQMIQNGVIGLIIIVAAYAITAYVVELLQTIA